MGSVIIGSSAMLFWGVHTRTPSDLDILSTDTIKGADVTIIPQSIIDLVPSVGGYATIDALYTIKCSHLGWDIQWQKHKRDVLHLKREGAKKIDKLYDALVGFWREEHGNKEYLSLYRKKSDFFNDHVPYVYDHDYLHELVAYPNPPVYTYCLRDGEDVAIDKDKFFNLSKEKQLRMFMEEISVIAAERWLIPPKCVGKYTWTQAHNFSVHKTITSLTKNWATDFLIDHLDYFSNPDFKYYKHLLTTVKEGEYIMSKQADWNKVSKEIIEAYNDSDPRWTINDVEEFLEISSFGDFKTIASEGGGEGGTEECFNIFEWRGVTYKVTYSYYSYRGYDFDYPNLYIVEAKQKTVTVYE